MYQIGYRGVGELQHADGNHEGLFEQEQTDEFPWQFDFDNSDVFRDESNDVYYEKYIVSRDFTTTHSQIPLKAGGTIQLNMGYKVFLNVNYVFANSKGYVQDLEFSLLEGRAFNMLSASLAASAAALALLTF